MKAEIFNIQRYCLHDGPGIRTTVFFKGCPLRCIWCHNPESRKSSRQLMYYESKCVGCGKCLGLCGARVRNPERPEKILTDRSKCDLCGKCIENCFEDANEICGREADTEEIFETVLKDRMFYGDKGGMTLSGGEPSMQAEASLELTEKASEHGLNTVIETCGYGKSNFFLNAADYPVWFYFDIKAIDNEKHKTFTGVSNKNILENFNLLIGKNAKIVLRLPIVPGLNDSDGDLELLGRFLSDNQSGFDHAEIMKYHNLGISKSRALNIGYSAPPDNASSETAIYWLEKLKSYGCEKILFS